MKNIPKFLSLAFVGPKKSRKSPAEFPANFASQKDLHKITHELLQARRQNSEFSLPKQHSRNSIPLPFPNWWERSLVSCSALNDKGLGQELAQEGWYLASSTLRSCLEHALAALHSRPGPSIACQSPGTQGTPTYIENSMRSQFAICTIRNSRITFHHFILRELYFS